MPQQPGGKGSKGSKNLQQAKSLPGFKAWFGSLSWINTLYIWFPASWARSVVDAIIKRNEQSRAQFPLQRDPEVL